MLQQPLAHPLPTELHKALLEARQRRRLPQPQQPGTLTNEAGPQVETNYPLNAWPSDGDHS